MLGDKRLRMNKKRGNPFEGKLLTTPIPLYVMSTLVALTITSNTAGIDINGAWPQPRHSRRFADFWSRPAGDPQDCSSFLLRQEHLI
jgi:hypothetical protein